MRIKDLAQELGVDTKELSELMEAWFGLTVINAFSSISDKHVKAIRSKFQETPRESQAWWDSEAEAEPAGHGGAERPGPQAPPTGRKAGGAVAAKPSRKDEAATVAMYGVRTSGKTVFWASLIEHVLKLPVPEILGRLSGWRPDTPVGKSRKIARQVVEDVLKRGDTDATEPSNVHTFKLAFRKRFALLSRLEVVFRSHDMAGEVFEHWMENEAVPEKALDALEEGARSAAGLLILIDPTQGPQALRWQDHLWRSLLDRLRERSGKNSLQKPVVFAFSKADDPAVCDELGMPNMERREAASADRADYRRLCDEQDLAARRFLQEHFPKVWVAIDRRDRQRFVRSAGVMAFSSLGMPPEETARFEELSPWRVTDPFVFILDRLSSVRKLRRRGFLVKAALFAAGLFGFLLPAVTREIEGQRAWADWEQECLAYLEPGSTLGDFPRPADLQDRAGSLLSDEARVHRLSWVCSLKKALVGQEPPDLEDASRRVSALLDEDATLFPSADQKLALRKLRRTIEQAKTGGMKWCQGGAFYIGVEMVLVSEFRAAWKDPDFQVEEFPNGLPKGEATWGSEPHLTVIAVDPELALAYSRYLGADLPREEEWEVAAGRSLLNQREGLCDIVHRQNPAERNVYPFALRKIGRSPMRIDEVTSSDRGFRLLIRPADAVMAATRALVPGAASPSLGAPFSKGK